MSRRILENAIRHVRWLCAQNEMYCKTLLNTMIRFQVKFILETFKTDLTVN